MDLFEELLGKHNHHSRKHLGHHAGRHHYDRFQDNRYPSGRSHDGDDDHYSHTYPLLRQLMGNKKVIGILLLVAAILALLVVGTLILLFPIMLKMAGLVGEDGVASVLEQAKPLVDTLKLGNAK